MANTKDTTIFVRLEVGWKERVRALAEKNRRTMSDITRIMIERAIEEMEEASNEKM